MLARVEEAAHIVSQGAVRRFHMLCREYVKQYQDWQDHFCPDNLPLIIYSVIV